MKKTALHATVTVNDARPTADYATIAIAFSDAGASEWSNARWLIRAQRNNLAHLGRSHWDVLNRETLVRFEAEKIEHDAFAEQWDAVPGFGAPYACELEARPEALASSAFLAFVRCVNGHGYNLETPAQLLSLLASDKRISLTVDWEYWHAGTQYTHIHDVPSDRRYGFGRFLNSADVLEAKAKALLERAESERQRAARRAAEECEAAE